MSASLIEGLQSLPKTDLQLLRCQVDVSFPPGYKFGPQPHCPWYRECNGSPQIIEVKDTGWETYHFPSVRDAQRFVEFTQQKIEEGRFAGGRFPPGSQVMVQQRATIEVVRDLAVTTP
jgi:hypothetical protein